MRRRLADALDIEVAGAEMRMLVVDVAAIGLHLSLFIGY
jgi:hypothetical protein